MSKAIGIICKIHKNMPCTILGNLYFTLIHPYLDYCNVIWAGNKTDSLECLNRLQKRAIRVVTNSKWNCHTALLFLKLYVLTRYNINKYVIMYKIHDNLLPLNFVSFLVITIVQAYITNIKQKKLSCNLS